MSGRSRAPSGWIVSILLLLVAAPARATELDQFQNARVAYESLNYELAADLFQGLLAQAAASDRRPLVLESRKYLGAALLFLGRPAEAEAQFALLLRADPGYVLDPLTFPEEVNAVFARVRTQLEREQRQAAAAAAQATAEQQKAEAAQRARRAERIGRLKQLASVERVEHTRSRWIALLPFGIGQFQNDHDSLGMVLAVAQGTLLLASITSYLLHESLRDESRATLKPEARDDAVLAERGFRYGNHVSLALLGAVAVGGIIDAQIRYQPTHTVDRRRPLPEDLDELTLHVVPGPHGLTLAGTF